MHLQLPVDALRAGVGYLRQHPNNILAAARHAAGMRVVVPLDALRWLVAHAPASKRAPKDVELASNPPAITASATIDLMGNAIRAGADISIEELRLSPEELRVTLRLARVQLEALDPRSPAAMLFKSLDKTKPGNLVNFMPKRPKVLVEAKDDRLILDFLKLPKLAENELVRRFLRLITPVLVIRDIYTEDDNLVVAWRPRPSGLRSALSAFLP